MTFKKSSSVPTLLEQLSALEREHPFWSNRLFRACKNGSLTLEDFRLIFTQYHLYSRNFTRYLAGLMANSDDDLFRARLSLNLWEEGGGATPDKRHAELFRNFLRDTLEVDLETVVYLDGTRAFVNEYLRYCTQSPVLEASAFLSLGTEGIVARMYDILSGGLIKAGLHSEELAFFHLHIQCDDEHAATIHELMLSYADRPGWFETCASAMSYALSLRQQFFESLFEAVQQRRISTLIDRIQARDPLPHEPSSLRHSLQNTRPVLYANTNERLNIEFAVEEVPFSGEVLDPRIVRIPPGRCNENHRHAHESVFYVLQGSGKVIIGDTTTEVRQGDLVFVPRWVMHQSQNTGEGEMVILAITDYGLTGKAYVGDYLKTARHKHPAHQLASQ